MPTNMRWGWAGSARSKHCTSLGPIINYEETKVLLIWPRKFHILLTFLLLSSLGSKSCISKVSWLCHCQLFQFWIKMRNFFWAALLSFFLVTLAIDKDAEVEVESKNNLTVPMIQNFFLHHWWRCSTLLANIGIGCEGLTGAKGCAYFTSMSVTKK